MTVWTYGLFFTYKQKRFIFANGLSLINAINYFYLQEDGLQTNNLSFIVHCLVLLSYTPISKNKIFYCWFLFKTAGICYTYTIPYSYPLSLQVTIYNCWNIYMQTSTIHLLLVYPLSVLVTIHNCWNIHMKTSTIHLFISLSLIPASNYS